LRRRGEQRRQPGDELLSEPAVGVGAKILGRPPRADHDQLVFALQNLSQRQAGRPSHALDLFAHHSERLGALARKWLA